MVRYARWPARSCFPSLLETSSATWGDRNRDSSARWRSTVSSRRALAIAMAAWSENVCARLMSSSVKGATVKRTTTTTPISSSSMRIGTPSIDR